MEHSMVRGKRMTSSPSLGNGRKTGPCRARVTTESKILQSGGIEVGYFHQQRTRVSPRKGSSVLCRRTSQRTHSYLDSAYSEGCWQVRQRARGQNRGRCGHRDEKREVGTRALSVSFPSLQQIPEMIGHGEEGLIWLLVSEFS